MGLTAARTKRKYFLRAAALISLIFAGGHTFGTIDIVLGGAGEALARQMVVIEGIEKPFSGIFLGYGYMITVFLVLHGFILWGLSLDNTPDNRMIIGVFAVASLLNTAVSFSYLIFIPTLFLLAITLCVLGAFFTGKNSNA